MINSVLNDESLKNYLESCMYTSYKNNYLKYLYDFDDFKQEVYITILEKSDKYDSSKSSLKTFLTMIVNNKACELKRSITSKKRHLLIKENVMSLDMQFEHDTDGSESFYEVVEDKNVFENVRYELYYKDIKNSYKKKIKNKKYRKMFDDMAEGLTDEEVCNKYNIKYKTLVIIKRKIKKDLKIS